MPRKSRLSSVASKSIYSIDTLDNCRYTIVMTKQMISFTDPQIEFLRAEAKSLGISVAELVRRIVDQYRNGRST